MSDKPVIDLQKRRKLMQRMALLEKSMKELRREFATPEQLQKLALGEVQSLEKHCSHMSASFKLAEPWLLENMTLWGCYLKLNGHDPDPADALAMVTKNSAYAKDSFKAAVLARLAQLEDECIQ